MVSDAISDMLIRIKNAYLARHKDVTVPYSKLKKSLSEILVKEGFAKEVKVENSGAKKNLLITLRYEGRKPVLTNLKIISKPSLRFYVTKNRIPRVLGGLGISVLSTSKGLMTGFKAQKEKIGGELLFKMW